LRIDGDLYKLWEGVILQLDAPPFVEPGAGTFGSFFFLSLNYRSLDSTLTTPPSLLSTLLPPSMRCTSLSLVMRQILLPMSLSRLPMLLSTSSLSLRVARECCELLFSFFRLGSFLSFCVLTVLSFRLGEFEARGLND
jgi:hypothetical protein